ncbi:hypothetical protein CDAR_167341 [Caerostris darwini]|uniref:Uncharacterized protein n=1 Tax=Caerostris darwini TaxID=1538125 RepID=A0AAV4VXT3_9ARAC|nr:hypothetical protein CDAR_167341 [Caerostris darwini]
MGGTPTYQKRKGSSRIPFRSCDRGARSLHSRPSSIFTVGKGVWNGAGRLIQLFVFFTPSLIPSVILVCAEFLSEDKINCTYFFSTELTLSGNRVQDFFFFFKRYKNGSPGVIWYLFSREWVVYE